MKRAVFLDRDGVINRAFISNGKPFPPKSIDYLEILPGVEDAINVLKAHDFDVIIVTNQPDVARKKTSHKNVHEIHNFLKKTLKIDGIIACFHDDNDNCNCRKPKPGMLTTIAKENNIDLQNSFMVGDRWRDIGAGINAGTKTIFIDYSYSEKLINKPDYITDSLINSIPFILGANYEKS